VFFYFFCWVLLYHIFVETSSEFEARSMQTIKYLEHFPGKGRESFMSTLARSDLLIPFKKAGKRVAPAVK